MRSPGWLVFQQHVRQAEPAPQLYVWSGQAETPPLPDRVLTSQPVQYNTKDTK